MRMADMLRDVQTTVCKVTRVDSKKLTCDCEPLNGDAPFMGVRLRAAITGSTKGAIHIPKKDSEVIVGMIGDNAAAAYVCSYSDIEEVWLEIDKGKYIKMKGSAIEINGDKYSLIKDDELKAELKKYTSIIQAIMMTINGMPITQPANAPSALQAALKLAIAGKQLPTFQNILNEEVKHG